MKNKILALGGILALLSLTACGEDGNVRACELYVEDYDSMLLALEVGDIDLFEGQLQRSKSTLNLALEEADSVELTRAFDTLRTQTLAYSRSSSEDQGFAFFYAMAFVGEACEGEHGVEYRDVDA